MSRRVMRGGDQAADMRPSKFQSAAMIALWKAVPSSERHRIIDVEGSEGDVLKGALTRGEALAAEMIRA